MFRFFLGHNCHLKFILLPTCPFITLTSSSWTSLAPTSLQYNSGPSIPSPQVADAVIFLPSAKLKYGGVRISALAGRFNKHVSKTSQIEPVCMIASSRPKQHWWVRFRFRLSGAWDLWGELSQPVAGRFFVTYALEEVSS